MNTDRIEKKILLHAPLARVWRALSDSAEFGAWFGMRLDGPFTPGATLRGVLTPTTVDAEVGNAQKPHAGLTFEITVEQVEPGRRLSLRWHPNAVEKGVDYSAEPTTLVVFTLETAPDGLWLTVSESGFDSIPLERRAQACSANERGWSMMVKVIAKYVESPQ